MRKTIKFLFFVIASTALTISSYAQTADVVKGCLPLSVKFAPPAAKTSYYWNFKDGTTSILETPSNIFTRGGTYNVTFQETPTGPILGTIQIVVYDKPALTITVPPGCAPLNAQFTNTTQLNPNITVSNYVWVWGDGLTSSGLDKKNASHTYNNVGKYSVSFSIETQYPSCNVTTIFNNVVDVITPPTASFITNPSPAASCNDTLNVGFTNQSTGVKPLTYAWNLGNSKTSTLQTPPSQQYIKGQYTPTLSVSYTGITGCTATASQTVSAGSPQPNIIFQNKDTVCLNVASQLKTTTPGRYLWTFDSGTSASSTTNSITNVTFSTPGLHQVTLKVTSFDGLCTGSKTIKMFVDDVTATLTGGPTFHCQSPAVNAFTATSNLTTNQAQYSWSSTATTKTSTTSSFSYNVKSATDSIYYGTNGFEFYFTKLDVTSKQSGCTASVLRIDTLWLPNALMIPKVTSGCAPLDVNFVDSSTTAPNNPIVQWKWLFGDGSTVTAANKNAVNHTYTTPGTYKARLLVTTKNGCIDTSYAVTIEVGSDLSSSIDFTTDKSQVCPNENVTFTTNISNQTAALIDDYHFSTEANRMFHCTDQKSATWSYNDLAGPQDVSLTVDYNGCLSKVNKTGFVTVKGAIAKIDYTALCSQPLTYNYVSKSINASDLNWTFGDSQTSTNVSESHTYATSGAYTVILDAKDASSGCSSTKDTAYINAVEVEANIKLNKDGLVCAKVGHVFDASTSKNVNGNCYTGYTWEFPSIKNMRPYTTSNAVSTFRFDTTGTHLVRLVVKDINGCKDTTTARFKVYGITPDMISDVSKLCVKNDVQFTDKTVSDTTIKDWNWSFGDSQFASTQNPLHNYTTAAPNSAYYIVNLAITDILGCTKDTTININYYKPTSSIFISRQNHCLGDTISISATDYTAQGSSLDFAWRFGNGDVSTKQLNKIVYDTAQFFNVTLIYKEKSSGCVDSTSSLVNVQSYPLAYIHTDVDKTLKYLCADKNITFTDSSQSRFPLSQYWDFGNGQTTSTNTWALFYPKGTFTTTHIVSTSNGCKDTATVSYTIVRPDGDFDIDKQTICKGDSIQFTVKNLSNVSSYSWIYGDGYIDNDVSPIKHKYNFHPVDGSTKATLLLRGYEDQCPWPIEKVVNIRKVIADFSRENGGDTSICVSQGGYHLQNTSIGYSSFSWNFGDIDQWIPSTEMAPIHVFAPGTYKVQIAIKDNQFNCVDTIAKTAIVYSNPVINVTSDTVCVGNTIQLNVLNSDPSSNYLWTPNTGLTYDTITSQTLNLAHTVNYTVMVTDTNSCMDTTISRAIVIEPINLQDWDTTIVVGDRATLPVYATQNVYNFKWTPNTGLSCLSCNYPVVQPLKDINYQLEVSDIKSCFNSTYQFDIKVRPETFVKLPTVFTPNGDGNNDVVTVKGWGIKELVDFSIYNRWGQLLFSSNNIDEGWDGKFQGNIQSNDVYIYKVKAKTWREEEITKEGYINLLR